MLQDPDENIKLLTTAGIILDKRMKSRVEYSQQSTQIP